MFFAYVQKSRDIYIVYIGVGKIRVASVAIPMRYRCDPYPTLCHLFT